MNDCMSHQTKIKGDLALMMVMASLTRAGCASFLPVSDHLPIDLIAMAESGEVARIQVKYSSLRNGAIAFKLTTVYSNSKGSHKTRYDLSKIDGFAIYCPETETAYFVRSGELGTCKDEFSLRVSPSDRVGGKPFRWAKEYTDPLRLFETIPSVVVAEPSVN